jgi:hypothetical protein
MGLDQYLYATKYLTKASKEYEAVLNAVDANAFGNLTTHLEINVAQWRKSNHIHHWFVQNCQDGEDNCQRSNDISREELVTLLDLCKQVSADHSLAEELLPCQGGFFFGSTEYDEWYFASIDETITKLFYVLDNTPEDWDFYYQSSW